MERSVSPSGPSVEIRIDFQTLHGDQLWLAEKLPALSRGLDWVKLTRAKTKKLNPDGSKPLNYGWFPDGRVSDATHGTSVFTDSNIWRGMEFTTQVLESIQHPRAQEFRTEADDYRRCIQDGEKIEVHGLQAEFGPITFSVRSSIASGKISAEVSFPKRNPPHRLKTRFRSPKPHRMKSVKVNGRSWTDFDPEGEWVTIPGSLAQASATAEY